MMIAAVIFVLGSMLLGSHNLVPSHRAKDSTLKANLMMMRFATESFQADCGGYPVDLNGLTTKPTQCYVGSVLTPIPADSWKGPYLNAQGGIGGGAILRNPYLPGADTDVAHHWTYDGINGRVNFPTPVGNDANGDNYTDY